MSKAQVYRGYLLTFARADQYGRPDRWYAERLIRTGSDYDYFYFPSAAVEIVKQCIDKICGADGCRR